MTVSYKYQTKCNKTSRKPAKSKALPPEKPSVREQSRSRSLEKLKDALIARRNSLRRNLNDEEDALVYDQNDVQVGDTVDAALESAESELEYRFVELGSKEFAQIERSLKRFENGEYGICDECGCQIPIARLKVLPFAERCVQCQQLNDDAQNRSSHRGWRSYDYATSTSTPKPPQKSGGDFDEGD